MRLCPLCDREHAANWRQFSHACHRAGAVCWARAAETELTDSEIDGIAAHELGHIVADALGLPAHRRTGQGYLDREGVEAEANDMAWRMGLRIWYNDRTIEDVTVPRR